MTSWAQIPDVLVLQHGGFDDVVSVITWQLACFTVYNDAADKFSAFAHEQQYDLHAMQGNINMTSQASRPTMLVLQYGGFSDVSATSVMCPYRTR